MKISQRTLEILENMTNINENLVIVPSEGEGTKIATKTVSSNVFASAQVPENFSTEVAIYELSNLLSVARLIDDPDFTFSEKFLTIQGSGGSNRNQVRYFYADKAVLSYPEKDVQFPEPDARVSVSREQYEKIKKAAATLKVPNISIIAEGGVAYLRAHDVENDSTNRFDVDLGDVSEGGTQDFSIHFTTDTLPLLKADYVVDICLRGITRFYNAEYDLCYYVAMKVS